MNIKYIILEKIKEQWKSNLLLFITVVSIWIESLFVIIGELLPDLNVDVTLALTLTLSISFKLIINYNITNNYYSLKDDNEPFTKGDNELIKVIRKAFDNVTIFFVDRNITQPFHTDLFWGVIDLNSNLRAANMNFSNNEL